jgi:hypothetical protein
MSMKHFHKTSVNKKFTVEQAFMACLYFNKASVCKTERMREDKERKGPKTTVTVTEINT